MIRCEGEQRYAARKWHPDDTRQKFSTVTTKQMLDVLKRFVDKANETDGIVDIKSRICAAEAPCWICKKKETQRQDLARLTSAEAPTNVDDVAQRQRKIQMLEKQLRKECGNKKSAPTWLKKIREGNWIWGTLALSCTYDSWQREAVTIVVNSCVCL